MPSAIDSMSVIVSDDQLAGKEASIMREMKRVLEPDRIDMNPELALIATVGEGMAYRVGVAGELFGALREAGVNIRMISQGASEINIIIGVEARDYERTVQAIYDAFVK
jgi:aspartate kinase